MTDSTENKLFKNLKINQPNSEININFADFVSRDKLISSFKSVKFYVGKTKNCLRLSEKFTAESAEGGFLTYLALWQGVINYAR